MNDALTTNLKPWQKTAPVGCKECDGPSIYFIVGRVGPIRIRKLDSKTGAIATPELMITHACEELRAIVNNGHDWRIWWFSAEGHRHGWYNRETQEWGYKDDEHFSPMCVWLFGDPPNIYESLRPRDQSWGVVCAEGRWHVAVQS